MNMEFAMAVATGTNGGAEVPATVKVDYYPENKERSEPESLEVCEVLVAIDGHQECIKNFMTIGALTDLMNDCMEYARHDYPALAEQEEAS